jgi:hypothetical protein
MTLTAFENGQIVVQVDEGPSVCYSRTISNQLIQCARMNNWQRFTLLWKQKTDPNAWEKIEKLISEFDRTRQWKLKEAFARLATTDADPPSVAPSVVKTVAF